jgi:hypothetical protein
MQLKLIRSFQEGGFPKEAIPYSSAALRQDLDRIKFRHAKRALTHF